MSLKGKPLLNVGQTQVAGFGELPQPTLPGKGDRRGGGGRGTDTLPERGLPHPLLTSLCCAQRNIGDEKPDCGVGARAL